MDQNSINRRLFDVCIQVNQLLSDIKEHRRDIQELQKQRDNGQFLDIYEYDVIDERSQNEGSSGRV